MAGKWKAHWQRPGSCECGELATVLCFSQFGEEYVLPLNETRHLEDGFQGHVWPLCPTCHEEWQEQEDE